MACMIIFKILFKSHIIAKKKTGPLKNSVHVFVATSGNKIKIVKIYIYTITILYLLKSPIVNLWKVM